MAVTQYIGSRYVPLFADPAEWSPTKSYEALTIVLHEGNSYTSKQAVPVGVDITNGEYWAQTGNYNAQIEAYRRETAEAKSEAEAAQASAARAQSDIDTLLPKSDFSSDNTVSDAIAATNARISNSGKFKLTIEYMENIHCYVHSLTIPRDSIEVPYLAINGIDYTQASQYVHNASNKFFINGSLGTPRISKGVVDGETRGSDAQGWYVFGFDAAGNPKYDADISFTMTGSRMVAAGYVCGFPVWSPIVLNGVPYDYTSEIPSSSPDYEYIFKQKQPRSVFGWDDDNYYLIAAEGRIPFAGGLDFAQLVTMCRLLKIPNAVNMDGGGSTQLWVTNPATNLVYSRDVKVSQAANVPYSTRNVQALIVCERKENQND